MSNPLNSLSAEPGRCRAIRDKNPLKPRKRRSEPGANQTSHRGAKPVRSQGERNPSPRSIDASTNRHTAPAHIVVRPYKVFNDKLSNEGPL